jgi:hypothetical protein
MLEVVLIDRRRRGWEWQVRDRTGLVLSSGREKSRAAARYRGARALFQLLASSLRLVDLEPPS